MRNLISAAVYNRLVMLYSITLVLLIFGHILDFSNCPEGMLIFLFVPFTAMAHFITALILDILNRKANYNQGHAICATFFLIVDLLITVRGLVF